MTFQGIMYIVIFIAMLVIVALVFRLYWCCRSDNGYNMGRNHMMDLGFTDEDIKAHKDDEDERFYVFRQPNRQGKKDKDDE